MKLRIMKKYFLLSSILLYILNFLLFFLIGIIYVKITGAAEGQGLAGGAIVLFNGLLFGFLGIVIGIIVVYRFSRAQIARLNKVLAALVVLSYGVVIYSARLQASENINSMHPEVSSYASSQLSSLGLFKPHIHDIDVLSFYQSPFYDTEDGHIQTIDSVRFANNEYGNRIITYAPPWLAPAHMKLDYDILYFEVVSLGTHYAEIKVNKFTNRSSWISLEDGTYIDWSKFIVSVHSIESNKQDLVVYRRPFPNSDKIEHTALMLQPVIVRDRWLKVKLIDDEYNVVDEGWIRWRDENEILIQYNLLS